MGEWIGLRGIRQISLLAVGLANWGSAALAQEIAFDPSPTVSCLSDAVQDNEDALNCVGAAANACSQTREGGTTYGMVMCFRAEKQWWELRLAVAYTALMVQHRADDKELLKRGSRATSKAESLEAMQKAWIVWRGAYCDYERATWSDGSVSGPMSVHCRMMLTGRQSLILESELRH